MNSSSGSSSEQPPIIIIVILIIASFTTLFITSLLRPPAAGRHLHVRREAGGPVGQRDGRAVGVQRPAARLVAADAGPAPSLRPGGPQRPRGGAGRRRAGDARLLRLLADLQLHQQSPGVQLQWVFHSLLLLLILKKVNPPDRAGGRGHCWVDLSWFFSLHFFAVQSNSRLGFKSTDVGVTFSSPQTSSDWALACVSLFSH